MTERPEDEAASLIGRIVDRRYRVDGLVGRGAHGVVYRAWHLMLDAPVALKVLAMPDERRAARFARETRALLTLRHPHIVTALDMGEVELAPGETPRPYLVMDWCEGETLDAYLARRGALTLAEAFEIAEPLADALAHAHDLGVVHCDVKPSNVMVARDARGLVARLVDFGVSTIDDERAPGDRGDAPVFTPAYAAPEQVVGDPSGPFTDVHALGLVLVEMLTGAPPYERGRELEDAVDPDRPRARVEGTELGAFEPVITRALAQRPAERFADGTGLRDALREAARVELGEGAPPSSLRTPARPSRSSVRRWWPAGLIAMGLAIAGAVMLVVMARRAEGDRAGKPTSSASPAPAEASADRSPCAWSADDFAAELDERKLVMRSWSQRKDASVNVVVANAKGALFALELVSSPGDVASESSPGRSHLEEEATSFADAPGLGVRYAVSSECLFVAKGPAESVGAVFDAVREPHPWTALGWAPDGPDPDRVFPPPPAAVPPPASLSTLSNRELARRIGAAGGQVYDTRLTPSTHGESFEVFFAHDGELATAWLERGSYARVVLTKFVEAGHDGSSFAITDDAALMVAGVRDRSFPNRLLEGLGISATTVSE